MKCWACRKREAVPEAAFCDPCLEAFEEDAASSRDPLKRSLAKLALRYSRHVNHPARRGRVTWQVRRICTDFGEPMPMWAAKRVRPPAPKPVPPPSTPLSHYLMCDAAALLGVTPNAIRSRVARRTCPSEVHVGRTWIPAAWVHQELLKKCAKKPIPDMPKEAAA